MGAADDSPVTMTATEKDLLKQEGEGTGGLVAKLASVPNHHPFLFSHQVNLETSGDIMSYLSPRPRCEWMLWKPGNTQAGTAGGSTRHRQEIQRDRDYLPTSFLPHHLVSV